ncbi:MAG: hypothetical protein M1820_007839 [Bogoriella megaspora]|nr:MAG: hypothetical protein M1820_007839 [Bogoriella megaspora]
MASDRFILSRLSPDNLLRLPRQPSCIGDPFEPPNRNTPIVADERRQLRTSHRTASAASPISPTTIAFNVRNHGNRAVSHGGVWNVGGSRAISPERPSGVPNGRGGRNASGTNAPLYSSSFLTGPDPEADLKAHERRIALALDIDQNAKILSPPSSPSSSPTSLAPGLRPSPSPARSPVKSPFQKARPAWRDNQWVQDDDPAAYSSSAKCLAVGLGTQVYLWSEKDGVNSPISLNTSSGVHVTSVAFSSSVGGQAILAIGRADGKVTLWSPYDEEPRFDSEQPHPVSCVTFNSILIKRPSARDSALSVGCEELLVGDEVGHVYIYNIEWPSERDRDIFGFPGAMILVARLAVHQQQICGLAWSSDGNQFATGGNDNSCCLFEIRKILSSQQRVSRRAPQRSYRPNDINEKAPCSLLPAPNAPSSMLASPPDLPARTPLHRPNQNIVIPGHGHVLSLPSNLQTHTWPLRAAVKALAFCPWQSGLLAAGGGSNDRCIHFFETRSGATLARIDCSAQVTGLIWSPTRREICATFGFPQPEHQIRIAVFGWPRCEQLAAIPWSDEARALCAVACPKEGRATEGGKKGEGCVIVATSEASIKFHEVWSEGGEKKGATGGRGLLGGSKILEGLHGVEEVDAVVR